VMMSKFMALTGLATPRTHLILGVDQKLEVEGLAPPRNPNDPEPEHVWVASEMEHTFQDLGKFLLNNITEYIPNNSTGTLKAAQDLKDSHAFYIKKEATLILEASDEVKELLGKQKPDKDLTPRQIEELRPIRLAKLKQLEALKQLYQLLPQDLKYEIEVAYHASQWIANWDFMNFSMYNTGFIKDESGRRKSMVVDYGNSGPAGFKGQTKDHSHASAIARAKVQDPLPSNETLGKEDAEFSTHIAPSISGIGSLPRTGPFNHVVEELVAAESHLRGDVHSPYPGTHLPKPFHPALEVAYRLRGISDSDILNTAKQHWPFGKTPEFQIGHEYYTAESIAHIMIARKNEFVARFTDEQLDRWAQDNLPKALHVKDGYTARE
jgi:hypothetical protein